MNLKMNRTRCRARRAVLVATLALLAARPAAPPAGAGTEPLPIP
jgi:hypothetical protein